jgi:hypothetical protein
MPSESKKLNAVVPADQIPALSEIVSSLVKLINPRKFHRVVGRKTAKTQESATLVLLCVKSNYCFLFQSSARKCSPIRNCCRFSFFILI